MVPFVKPSDVGLVFIGTCGNYQQVCSVGIIIVLIWVCVVTVVVCSCVLLYCLSATNILNYKNCVPCVVQLVHAVVVGANTVESNIGKTKEYHEAVNMAIQVRDLETFWEFTHRDRACLSTVAGVLYKTPHGSWDMNKEV